MKKILYIDMDGVLVDFKSGIRRISADERREYEGREDDVPGIFALMDPIPGALEAYRELSRRYDTYILSTAPWKNPSAWSDKVEWVQRHLGGEHILFGSERFPDWAAVLEYLRGAGGA